MAQTLLSILQDVGAVVDQDTATPTGTDLLTRANLANQAVFEWGETYQWQQLRVNGYAPSITVSGASMALPSNFEKLMSRPFDVTKTSSNDFEEIRPEGRFLKTSTDRYCYTGGDEANGKYLVINPVQASGVSLNLDFQSIPSSMATLQDISVVPDRNFVSRRVIAKIFQSRSDPRFPTFNQEAQDAMSNMIAEEAALSGAFTNRTRVQYDTLGFRVGDS